MKKFHALLITLAFSFPCSVFAHEASEWYGKEGQDEKPYYMESAIAKLPADKADNFRDNLKDAEEQNKPLQEKLYQLHGELHAILTAPAFDKGAFEDKREDIQKVHAKMEQNRTEAFALSVSELDQNERITLSRELHHHMIKQKKSWFSKSSTTVVKHNDTTDDYAGESDASIKH